MKKVWYIALLIFVFTSGYLVGAATSNVNARAKTPSGNWAPWNLDASGNLKVAAQ